MLGIFVSGQFPGVRTSLGVSCLNSLMKTYIAELESAMASSIIPSESFSFTVLLIPAKMTLENITVQDLSINQQSSTFYTDNSTSSVFLHISNVTFAMKANFTYHYPIISSGEMSILFSNVDMTIPTTLSLKDGMASGKIGEMTINAGNITVKFTPNGIISKIFGSLLKYWPLHNIAQHVYKHAIQSAPKTFNKDLEKFFQSIRYNDPVKNLTVSNDLHFLSLNITNSAIQFQQNGTFYITAEPSTLCPVTPPSFLPSFSSNSTFKIQFTSYFFDTFLWAVFASNTLNFDIPYSMIPKNFPYPFTTTGLNKIIPNFSASYGPNLPVSLECSVYKIPDAIIQNSINIYASIYCDFMVQVSPSVSVAAFRLLAQLETFLTGTLQSTNNTMYLYGNLDPVNSEFSNFAVTNSNIGNFNTAALAKAINFYI